MSRGFDDSGLSRLDGESLACEAVDAVMAQLDRLALHLFPPHRAVQLRAVSRQERATGRWRETALASDLGRSVRDLTRFAQGEDVDVLSVPTWIDSVLDSAFRVAAADDSHRPDDEAALRLLASQGALAAALGAVIVAARRRLRALRPTRPEIET
jgi:hypothetical protein